MPLLLQIDLLLLDQLDPRRQKLMDLGVYAQFDLLCVLNRVADELHPHKIIEEHPLVRMELRNLHKRYHFYQFQSCPMLVELILFGGGVESFVQKKDDVLPDSRKQFGQFLSRGPQNQNSDAEENEDEDGLRRLRIFSHLNNLINELLSLISILIFLPSI